LADAGPARGDQGSGEERYDHHAARQTFNRTLDGELHDPLAVHVRAQRVRRDSLRPTRREGYYTVIQCSAKVSSIVTSTGTGSPLRVPGRKRNNRAALTAS
jgi:hypothetical protein